MQIKTTIGLAMLSCLAVLLPYWAWAGSNPDLCSESLLQRIPPRASAALSARGFAHAINGLDEESREAAIRAQLLAGNMPRFLRRLIPVTLNGRLTNNVTTQITVCVLPDYLAIGSDEDFVIAPMQLKTALGIAGRYGFVLPTAKIVDAIYAQARAHLSPQPLPPGARMRSTDYFWRHNDLIFAQREALQATVGALTAGHKKDLVITSRLWTNPARIAIYGWHRTDGIPIQPLSTVHAMRYVDYSHGVRLVSDVAYVDGRPRSIIELLEDRRAAAVLNNEGPILELRKLMNTLSAPADSLRTAQRAQRRQAGFAP